MTDTTPQLDLPGQHLNLQKENNAQAPFGEPDGWWSECAFAVIKTLAASRHPFTSADIWRNDFGLHEPPHPNAVGAVFSRARKNGIIRPAGYTASSKKSRNGSVVRVWVGASAHIHSKQGGASGSY